MMGLKFNSQPIKRDDADRRCSAVQQRQITGKIKPPLQQYHKLFTKHTDIRCSGKYRNVIYIFIKKRGGGEGPFGQEDKVSLWVTKHIKATGQNMNHMSLSHLIAVSPLYFSHQDMHMR